MSLPDTLPIASFADLIRVSSSEFIQGWQQQRSIPGGGETRFADRAPSLWMAELTSPPMVHAEAEGLMALANSRAGGLKTVLLYNTKMPYPSSDPDGSIMGATVPKLGTISDRLQVAFTDFPADYVVPLGTYFGIVFDISRYYLGQFCEARTANGDGEIAEVEIWPPMPASISGTPDVNLKKPVAKFRLVPGSAYPSSISPVHSTFKLSAEQTYSA
jgi:hypothetical protein